MKPRLDDSDDMVEKAVDSVNSSLFRDGFEGRIFSYGRYLSVYKEVGFPAEVAEHVGARQGGGRRRHVAGAHEAADELAGVAAHLVASVRLDEHGDRPQRRHQLLRLEHGAAQLLGDQEPRRDRQRGHCAAARPPHQDRRPEHARRRDGPHQPVREEHLARR